MSYDIALWSHNGAITNDDALQRYLRYSRGETDADSSKAINLFVVKLTALFPQIDDCDEDSVDDCPWTNELDITRSYCILNIRHDHVERVLPIIYTLANECNLQYYNPQDNTVS